MRKFFANGLVLKNSLVSPKIGVKRNHFGEMGIFTKDRMRGGEIVMIIFDNVFTQNKLRKLPQKVQHYVLQLADDVFLGPTSKENQKSRFDPAEYINHSCNPNIGIIGNNVFVALRGIMGGEELTYDYATTDTDKFNDSWTCKCGEKNCREKIKPNDWKKPELQKKYKNYFAFYILEKIKKLTK